MPAYDGPIIDVDVHHRPQSITDLLNYLPASVRELVTANQHATFPLYPPLSQASAGISNKGRRADTFGSDDGVPGWNYALHKEQLLDRYNYHRAVLTHDVGEFGMHQNPEVAAAMCSAANDWTIDHWLSLDDRLCGLVVCPFAEPEAAAAEIRRVGVHPRMTGVMLVGAPLGRPFGDPVYHPIYKVAADMGLPLALHQAASERPKVTGRTTPSPVMTATETTALMSQQGMHFVSSFIVHGVFEKFPGLKLLVMEYGIAWIPSLLWRMDQFYDAYKLESSWVKKWPSDYVRENIKFSTQPIETSSRRHAVAELLQTVDGMEELLCFSSDYPHISFDDPTYVARLLPNQWQTKVFYDNACSIYRWDNSLVGHALGATSSRNLV